MLSYHLTPSNALTGTLEVPGDKSISHRASILAALADGESIIEHALLGLDNLATLNAIKSLGVEVSINEQTIGIRGQGLYGLRKSEHVLDLANSGTGLRLLAGVLAAQKFDSILTGDASLCARPMRRIVDPLRKMGAKIVLNEAGTAPLFIKAKGELRAIHYHLPIASAQLKSCLLLAALYAKNESILFEKIATRDHTERLLQLMNVALHVQNNEIHLKPPVSLRPLSLRVPGDISSAAFFMVAASIIPGSKIYLHQVGINPSRIGIIQALKKMGADIKLSHEHFHEVEPFADIEVNYAPLRAINMEAESVAACIDEFPVLFVAAAVAQGISSFKGIEELRFKETDRIRAMVEGLSALGIKTRSSHTELEIVGGVLRGGAEIDTDGDHRIAMALSIAASRADDGIVLLNCDNVATSYPGFVEDASKLGMNIQCKQCL